MTDYQNSQKMLVDWTHIIDIEFNVERKGWIYATVDVFTVICEITQSYEKITTRATYSLPNGS